MAASRLLSVLFALVLATSPATTALSAVRGGGPEANPGGQAGSACGVVEQAQYWLCKAFEDGDCGLISDSEDYWFCKGVLERQCGLIEGRNYQFCQALTTRNCGLVAGNRYWLCKGVTEQECSLAPPTLYWLCTALQDRFRA